MAWMATVERTCLAVPAGNVAKLDDQRQEWQKAMGIWDVECHQAIISFCILPKCCQPQSTGVGQCANNQPD
jgi:hypothetical protein